MYLFYRNKYQAYCHIDGERYESDWKDSHEEAYDDLSEQLYDEGLMMPRLVDYDFRNLAEFEDHTERMERLSK